MTSTGGRLTRYRFNTDQDSNSTDWFRLDWRTRRGKVGLSVVSQQHALELGSWTKIEQQTDLHPRGFEGVDQLRFVSWVNPLGPFDFYQHPIVNDEIGSKVAYLPASKPDRNLLLPPDIEAGICQKDF